MKVRATLFAVLWITLGLTIASEIPAQNAVADWHTVLESNVAGSGRKNAVALPFYAYVDVAMYDAVASINRRYQPFAVRVHAPRGASEDAAAARAAHDVLVHYLPLQAATLDAALATSLALIPDGPSKTDGIQVGQSVAAGWLAQRAGDGLEAPIVYTPGHGPGIWEPVPTFPAPPPNTPAAPVGVWLTQFKPFALQSADQFLDEVPPPPVLTSRTWARNFNLTKDFGALNSTVRTADQTATAYFWNAFAVNEYNDALRGTATKHHMDLVDTVRLFAMGDLVVTDSGIACFDSKYHYLYWRPITAIQNADIDGNPATIADPAWAPLLTTPGHSEYPAAHGCLTSAFVQVIAKDLHTKHIDIDMKGATNGSTTLDVTRHFDTVKDATNQVEDARVWIGFHYRNSAVQGVKLGSDVARWSLNRYFRPARGDGNNDDENDD